MEDGNVPFSPVLLNLNIGNLKYGSAMESKGYFGKAAVQIRQSDVHNRVLPLSEQFLLTQRGVKKTNLMKFLMNSK